MMLKIFAAFAVFVIALVASRDVPITDSVQKSPCEKCILSGGVFTGVGCKPKCVPDTFCFKQCPPLDQLTSCEECHAFGGDWQVKAGCLESCGGLPCCIQNGVDQC